MAVNRQASAADVAERRFGSSSEFQSASHFSFRWMPDRERQKWRPDTGKPVVDLKAFRNLRYPMMPTDTPSILRREIL